jgi:serine/threonine protein kinase
MSSPIKSSSHEKRIEHVGPYLIQNRIGQGSFATVYKAQHNVKLYKIQNMGIELFFRKHNIQ